MSGESLSNRIAPNGSVGARVCWALTDPAIFQQSEGLHRAIGYGARAELSGMAHSDVHTLLIYV
jgi:hypothetical protein